MPVRTANGNGHWTVLLRDPMGEASLPAGPGFRVLRRTPLPRAAALHDLFVLCAASELGVVAPVVSAVNKRHQLRALFVRDNVEPGWLPQLFERAGLRMTRNVIVHSGAEVPKRVFSAWRLGAEQRLIANATVVNDRLLVVACDCRTYELPFNALAVLRRMPVKQRAAFDLAADGSYLHWAKDDIHLDLDAIRGALEPEWADARAAERVVRSRGYGRAIAAFREERGLRQSDIPGLSERQVRRVENGESLSAAALRLLAAGHGLEVAAYLDAIAEGRPHGRN